MSQSPAPWAWDYLTLPAEPAPDEATLNKLGRDAWELVAVSAGTLYFKRPALTFRERVTIDQKRHVYGAHGETVDEDGDVAGDAAGG